MSKRGFWFGLLAGLVIMGLVVGTVAVVFLGARWASGSKVALRGRSLQVQPGERGPVFGLRGCGGMISPRSHFGLGALFCCPALFLILGGVALAAFFGRRRCWHGHRGHHWRWHEGMPCDAEHAEESQEAKEDKATQA
jgi:hypothetical protein